MKVLNPMSNDKLREAIKKTGAKLVTTMFLALKDNMLLMYICPASKNTR